MRRLVLVLVIILLILILALPLVLNPERQGLTSDKRDLVTGQFVQLTDGVVHYEAAGPEDGPPVVLIHGLSVPYYLWDGTFEELADAGFRVLRYDLYGRGYSDRPAGPYDADFYERQLFELMEALRFEQPVDLVATSLGGVIASTFVLDHPERVRKLVLIDPFTLSRDTKPFVIPILGEYLTYTALLPLLPGMQSADFFDPDNVPADWLTRYKDQMQYRGFGRALLSTIRHILRYDAIPLYQELGAQERDVLLIWGEEDQTVPFEESILVRKALPDAQFFAVDNAGHLPQIERKDVVLPKIIEFLNLED
ncbi:MAG: alpha/beta hydrolase [Caldilineales bacterium]|nr:alpha/beta hydrolase [Caldilineales bacterium]